MAGKWLGAIALVGVLAACGSSSKGSTSSRDPHQGSAGIVVLGTAKQKVAADLAYVVTTGDPFGSVSGSLGVGESFGELGLPAPSDARAQLADLFGRLRKLGLADDAVHLDDSSLDEPDEGLAAAQVEVPVAKLPKIATQVAAAMDAATKSKTERGLRFGVENCAKAITTARPAAIADAHKRAVALAGAAGVEVGALRSVAESDSAAGHSIAALSALSSFYDTQPCGRSALEASSRSSLGDETARHLDAKPEVELQFSVAATYDLAETASRTLSATGNGEEEVAADHAVLFLVPNPFPEGPSIFRPGRGAKPLDKKLAPAVIDAVAKLGVAKKDIEVDVDEEPPYVEVTLTAARVKTDGAKVVAAVKGVLGEAPQAKVLFTSTKCEALVEKARKKAAADAALKIDGLARAAKVEAGPVVALSEPPAVTDPYALQSGVDPCSTELSDLLGPYGLLGLSGLSGFSGDEPSLVEFDASPVVTKRVSVVESRGITDD